MSNQHTGRSQIARDELRELGYTEYWQAITGAGGPRDARMVTRYSNGAGKSVLLIEYADGHGWDIYGQLSTSIRNSETLTALADFTKAVPHE